MVCTILQRIALPLYPPKRGLTPNHAEPRNIIAATTSAAAPELIIPTAFPAVKYGDRPRKRARIARKTATLLIDNYDSYTYNLFQLIAKVTGGRPPRQSILNISYVTQCTCSCQHSKQLIHLHAQAQSEHLVAIRGCSILLAWRVNSEQACIAENAMFCPADVPTVIQNDELSWRELSRKLLCREFDHIVISPGPGTPLRPSDIGTAN